MKISYVLTTFSPAMFGDGATVHIRAISLDEARSYTDDRTKIAATRISHERLARETFPGVASEVRRYAELKPGGSAILLHYRGPQVNEDGKIPVGGIITCYLIEIEEYQEHE